jgi:Rps23 Pro-64 3,4-dihydroxylase Tpa1-like proline 4-hydroxylase
MTCPIDIHEATSFNRPFPHFVAPQVIDTEVASQLLAWFDNGAEWTLATTDFYEQYESCVHPGSLPSSLGSVASLDSVARTARQMSSIFSVSLSEAKVDVIAHKLVYGQRIRLHNDHLPDGETHRLIIHLNRGWPESNGGLLALFDDSRPKALVRLITPLHLSAFGFAISQQSNHAVTPILAGNRYALVYSFFADGLQRD